ncbi:MAG: hypothetical protein EOO68_05560 [Moraxellaceae bacterium]|nr:MAG: hypothetical protein EOO68_05560 [Moraxellaceae bacterium]
MAQNDDGQLTKLNTYMRRIDLLSKLSAPVSVHVLGRTDSPY